MNTKISSASNALQKLQLLPIKNVENLTVEPLRKKLRIDASVFTPKTELKMDRVESPPMFDMTISDDENDENDENIDDENVKDDGYQTDPDTRAALDIYKLKNTKPAPVNDPYKFIMSALDNEDDDSEAEQDDKDFPTSNAMYDRNVKMMGNDVNWIGKRVTNGCFKARPIVTDPNTDFAKQIQPNVTYNVRIFTNSQRKDAERYCRKNNNTAIYKITNDGIFTAKPKCGRFDERLCNEFVKPKEFGLVALMIGMLIHKQDKVHAELHPHYIGYTKLPDKLPQFRFRSFGTDAIVPKNGATTQDYSSTIYSSPHTMDNNLVTMHDNLLTVIIWYLMNRSRVWNHEAQNRLTNYTNLSMREKCLRKVEFIQEMLKQSLDQSEYNLQNKLKDFIISKCDNYQVLASIFSM